MRIQLIEQDSGLLEALKEACQHAEAQVLTGSGVWIGQSFCNLYRQFFKALQYHAPGHLMGLCR